MFVIYVCEDNDNNNIIYKHGIYANNNINQDILILNSYEAKKREEGYSMQSYMNFVRVPVPNQQTNLIMNSMPSENEENEKEIKQCEIKINDVKIPFGYFYKFEKEGKYKITYSFKIYLTKTSFMFYNCSLLISIDLSNLNLQNVTNMSLMFSCCSSLANVNLSNLNTQNVISMKYIFSGCSSLKNVNLSYLNNQNLMTMKSMFYGCSSLINLDLSSFHTQSVVDMSSMLCGCSSLANLNLSNFNTKNVMYMNNMFINCQSLIDLDQI